VTRPSEYPLRPFLAADTMALRELFAQAIEELTQDDYDEEQRIAWASSAEDAQAFDRRLAEMLTLVVQVEGEYLGFAALQDNKTIDMLYVHPYYAGEGVGTALVTALEKIAAARGSETLSVDASDTAEPFFESLGYRPVQRNTVPRDDQWLSNTTMAKSLKPAASSTEAPTRRQ
jgi:putative acetyltransferase